MPHVVTYELWVQLSTKEWVCHKKDMNEEDAWYTAKVHGWKRKQFDKLVNHTSKKFNFLKKKGKDWWQLEINLVKNFA
jgi:hypothetical protein